MFCILIYKVRLWEACEDLDNLLGLMYQETTYDLLYISQPGDLNQEVVDSIILESWKNIIITSIDQH